MTNVTDEVLGKIARQQHDLFRRVREGSLDAEFVSRGIQDIIEGKVAPATAAITHVLAKQPAWYVSPAEQLKKVEALNAALDWGFVTKNIPAIPGYRPSDPNEVLMLAVSLPPKGRKSGLYHTFDELWNLIEAPDGYTKWRRDELKATSKLLRQAPDYDYTPGIRWVVFNPNAYHGKSPEAALDASKADGVDLAGVEVLMAALLFPDWIASWNGTDSPFPNLSGLQFYWDAGWSDVPYLDRWGGDRRLGLYAHWADDRSDRWASPSVREC